MIKWEQISIYRFAKIISLGLAKYPINARDFSFFFLSKKKQHIYEAEIETHRKSQ